MKHVITHRMSPDLHLSLRRISQRDNISLNKMYDVIMQAFIDRRLFCYRKSELVQLNGVKASEDFLEKEELKNDSACNDFADQLKGGKAVLL